MTLRRFLDIAHALIVEESTKLGLPLLTALDNWKKYGSGTGPEDEDVDPSEAQVARQNEQSLQELKKLMQGV